jgi:hypothetical protein
MDIDQYRYQKTKPTKKRNLKKDFLILLLAMFFLFFGIFMTFFKKDKTPIAKTLPEKETRLEEKTTPLQNPDEKISTYTIQEGDIPADVFQNQANFDGNDTLNLFQRRPRKSF